MTIASSGALSISDISSEFGGSGARSLSDYYAGAGLVAAGTQDPDGNARPSSGTIKISDFYACSKFVAQSFSSLTSSTTSTVPAGANAVHIEFAVAGGGGGCGGAVYESDGGESAGAGGGSSYYGHPQATNGATFIGSGGAPISSPLYTGGAAGDCSEGALDSVNAPQINALTGGPFSPIGSNIGEGGKNPGPGPAEDNEGHDGYVLIQRFAQSAAATSTTIVSNAFAANNVPTSSRIVVFEENVDTPTLNTDIIASISRDGGSTFTNATLTDSGYVTGSSGQRILTGQATISGQPSGQSMRWKLALANNQVKIHGVSLQWS